MSYPPYVLDFFGSVLNCLTRPTHCKYHSTLVQLALQPGGAKCLQHRSRLAADSGQSGLSEVPWEALDSTVQKLAPGSPPPRAPDPGGYISTTWELSAWLHMNTERYFLCLQIVRLSSSVTGLKKPHDP